MHVRGTDSLLGRIFLAAILAAAVASPVWAGYSLEQVRLEKGAGQATLDLTANGTIRYEVFQLTGPDRIVLDVLEASVTGKPEIAGQDAAGWLVAMRSSRWEEDPSRPAWRYVLETKGRAQYSVMADGEHLRLCVRESDLPATPASATRASAATAPPDGTWTPPDFSENQAGATADVTATGAPRAAASRPPLDAAPPLGAADPTVAKSGAAKSAPAARVVAGSAGAPGRLAQFVQHGKQRPFGWREVAPKTARDSQLAEAVPPPAKRTGEPGPGLPQLAQRTEGFPAVREEPPASSVTNPAGGGKPMNLDVQGADIRTVLRSISEFSGVNIVPDREISGPISVRLVSVPWRRALDIVNEAAGLRSMERGDVIRVTTHETYLNEELDQQSADRKKEEFLPLDTAIFPIQYANATELRQAVSFLLSKRGSAEVDSRTNSILVTDITERIDQIRQTIDQLDSETLQVEIVAKLVDVDATASRQFGIEWSIQNLHSNSERISGGITHSTPLTSAAAEMKIGVVRDWGNIDATIQALERTNKANIISNPSITTVNNRLARILVGKEIPLIVLDEAGNPITQLKKVGITLEVTPYINSEKRITLDLHPEVSDLSSQATVQGGIVFTTTEADTRVMVDDGQTAVIGGLIRTNDTVFEQGIPVLKDIPLLGNLFKTSETQKDRRELLIFVTPKIVRHMADAGDR